MDSHDSFIAQDSASIRGDDLANSLLNFATGPDDLDLQSAKRQKSARDPMSHRIIEKRRRDRMNNCLADLSRLIPTSYLKQGQGRIEKTEIIEMAIKHIKTLQAQVDSSQSMNYSMTGMKRDTGTSIDGGYMLDHGCCQEQFYQGFKECQDETLRYLVEGEAMVASDPFCVRVMDHLSNVSQRFDLSRMRGEDKKDTVMDMESQQPMSGTTSFSGSTTTSTPQPSLDLMLPLLPTSGGMMMPASPVRNKHLRNLLSARALQQLEAEREASAPQNSDHKCSSASEGGSTATSTPHHPAMSVCFATSMNMDASLSSGLGHCDNSMNGGGASSGYMSDTSAMDRFSNGSIMSAGIGDLMVNSKDSSAMNVYKFKHNITKRFSQEGKAVAQQYDGSSSTSSREAEDEHPHHGFLKQRSLKNKNRYASSSDSGPYPTSDLSGAISVSSHESIDGGPDRNGNRKVNIKALGSSDPASEDAECCSRSNMPLPGFVLHPSGTHYMPMSVCYNNIPELLDSSRDSAFGPPVFHPISIPVHFRGPVISMPGSNVHSQNSITAKSGDSTPSPKDVKAIKKG